MKSSPRHLLKQKIVPLNRFFQNDPRVLAAFLFGSQADGTASSLSDIDLAVLFDRELSLKEELTFEVQVSMILKSDDVDVVNLNHAPLSFRFRAIAGKLLYERDYVRVSDFIERTLIEHRDFEPRAQSALKDYFATL